MRLTDFRRICLTKPKFVLVLLLAAVFMKKGVSFTNILIFIGAWSTTKIPMFLFEKAALGPKFAWTRLAVDIPGIIIIAWVLGRMISPKEKEMLYQNAEDNLIK